MRSHISKPFLREIEKEFNRIYPYLRIEFPGNESVPQAWINDPEDDTLQEKARDLLRTNAGLADNMTVSELEATLQALFALPVQVFRKSGKIWIETKMTRNWTLKQQNDHGRALAQ